MNKVILTGMAALFLTLSSNFGLGAQASNSLMGSLNEQSVSSSTNANAGVTGSVNASEDGASADTNVSANVSAELGTMLNL